MTGYAIRRIGDQRFWTGARTWSGHVADARVFPSMTVAIGLADRDCPADPDTYTVEPVFVEDEDAFWRAAA